MPIFKVTGSIHVPQDRCVIISYQPG